MYNMPGRKGCRVENWECKTTSAHEHPGTNATLELESFLHRFSDDNKTRSLILLIEWLINWKQLLRLIMFAFFFWLMFSHQWKDYAIYLSAAFCLFVCLLGWLVGWLVWNRLFKLMWSDTDMNWLVSCSYFMYWGEKEETKVTFLRSRGEAKWGQTTCNNLQRASEGIWQGVWLLKTALLLLADSRSLLPWHINILLRIQNPEES